LPQEKQPRFIHNDSGRFESRFVTVKIAKSAASSVWFNDMEDSSFGVWIAHGEGRCYFPDETVRTTIEAGQQIPLHYVDDENRATETYPYNPNGSKDGVVGLCSPCGRHLGMMPHPERCTIFPQQWAYAPEEWNHGDEALKASPWLQLFQNAKAWCTKQGPSAKRRKIE